ncbi:hypothetical protein N7540_005715 [Penicillium herquei]|nr:hypothetical protein N7540_005715 [Penicillium herquei]
MLRFDIVLMGWFIIGLMVNQAHTQDILITTYFDVLGLNIGSTSTGESAGGSCALYESLLDEYMSDYVTLAVGMQEAIDYAQIEGDSKENIVARKLLTSWFGISFQDATVDDASQLAWEHVTEIIARLYDFATTGIYPAPATPPLLFCGSMGDWFEWDDQAFDSNGDEVEYETTGPNGEAVKENPTIMDLYEVSDETFADTAPYWIDPIGQYLFLGTLYDDYDLCETISIGSDGKGIAWANRGHPGVTRTDWSTDSPVEIDFQGTADGILLCPSLMSGNSEPYKTLAQVQVLEWGSTVQLSEILTESITLLHEMAHACSMWSGSGDSAVKNDWFVGDAAYDMLKILEMAQAGGTTSADNAESYVYFAMAWWYFTSSVASDVYPDVGGATFFSGILEAWSTE